MKLTKAQNKDRSYAIGRGDLISEAGEVFTPANVVSFVLEEPLIDGIVRDCSALVLEPAAGDGNFVVGVIERRLRKGLSFESSLQALKNIWAIEIQQDNLDVLKKRAVSLTKSLLNATPAQERQLFDWVDSNFLKGNFLSSKHCELSCSFECGKHNTLKIPSRFDLIVGNPPFNPRNQYVKFVVQSMQQSSVVSFILPTSWKFSSSYHNFRQKLLDTAYSWKELPWTTFSVKCRTGVLTLVDDVFLTKSQYTRKLSKDFDDLTFVDSILQKACLKWPDRLLHFYCEKNFIEQRGWPLYIGWKCNLRKDGDKVNALQSLDFYKPSSLLPHNVFSFHFPTEQLRRSWVLWSTTLLAAFLQQLTDSDTVSRELPFPSNLEEGFLEESLYDELNLTFEERSRLGSSRLYLSGKALEFYRRENVKVREDAFLGKLKKACADCGSSSFHRKGCSFSTEREKSLRGDVYKNDT